MIALVASYQCSRLLARTHLAFSRMDTAVPKLGRVHVPSGASGSVCSSRFASDFISLRGRRDSIVDDSFWNKSERLARCVQFYWKLLVRLLVDLMADLL